MARFKEEIVDGQVNFLKKVSGVGAASYYFAQEVETGERWLTKLFMFDDHYGIAPPSKAVMSEIYREILGNRLYAYFGIPVARLETQEMPAHFLEGVAWRQLELQRGYIAETL